MEIYLAASWLRRDEIRGYADRFMEAGFEITSRWLYSHDGTIPEAQAAQEDLEDVLRADTLVSFTSKPSDGWQSGGRHVELGVGLASNKRLFLVGPKENIFHYLPEINWFPDVDSLIEYLKITATIKKALTQ